MYGRASGTASKGKSTGLLDSTLQKLAVNLTKGLTYEQVFNRKQQYGSNELEAKQLSSIAGRAPGFIADFWVEYGEVVGQYVEQFQNPLILLLIGSAAISLLLGQYENAISIALVFVNPFIYHMLIFRLYWWWARWGLCRSTGRKSPLRP
jgi:magnesium-transporting ATPase (P-type)